MKRHAKVVTVFGSSRPRVGDAHYADAHALGAAVKERRAELEGLVTTTQEELERNFARWDDGAGERQELVNELKSALSRIAYLRTLTRDVDRALDSATAN